MVFGLSCGHIKKTNETALPLLNNENTSFAECPPQAINKNILLISAVVVVSLCLVLLIVMGLRQFYKPIRPRIKKTFVVRNKMDRKSKTPLTCRPVTEQCEITIEDCCNMNICDTVSH